MMHFSTSFTLFYIFAGLATALPYRDLSVVDKMLLERQAEVVGYGVKNLAPRYNHDDAQEGTKEDFDS